MIDGRDCVGAGPAPPLWSPLRNAIHAAVWQGLLAGIPVFRTALDTQVRVLNILDSTPIILQLSVETPNINQLQPGSIGGYEHPDVRRRQEVHASRQPRPQRDLPAKATAVGEKMIGVS